VQTATTLRQKEAAQKERDRKISNAELAVKRLEEIKDEGPIRAVKCRIQPTRAQHEKLLYWNKAVRVTYNKMVEACNEQFKASGVFPDLNDLRMRFVNSPALVGDMEWLKDVRYDVRDRATLDIARAVKAHYTRVDKWKAKCEQLKAKGVTDLPDKPKCHFQFRSRHDDQCLEIRSRDWNTSESAYADIFRPDKLACKRMPLPEEMAADFKVLYDRRKRWYICMPERKAVADPATAPAPERNAVVALDPGVRYAGLCVRACGCVQALGE